MDKLLTPEQTEQVKKQIIQQIENRFPEDKKQAAISQIKAMNSEQLEDFLKQNKLIKQGKGEHQCIFCSIVFGDIASYKIDENDGAIAVLEINPISMGHALVIPKEHLSGEDKIPKSVISLVESISALIKTKLKPKKIETSSSNLFGHEIINIIPVYDSENINSERSQANPKELLELQETLLKKKSEVISAKPKRKKIKSEKLWLPKRIP